MCSRSHLLSWSVSRGRDLRWGALSLGSSQTFLGTGPRVRETGSWQREAVGTLGPHGTILGGSESSERC